jgi:hypothetical protein
LVHAGELLWMRKWRRLWESEACLGDVNSNISPAKL